MAACGRGPNRDGQVIGFTAPKAWPKELTKKWTAAVGTGVSSPVLVGDKLYAFGRIGGDEVTTCLVAASGKPLWQEKYSTDHALPGLPSGYGGPRSTPAVAEGKVLHSRREWDRFLSGCSLRQGRSGRKKYWRKTYVQHLHVATGCRRQMLRVFERPNRFRRDQRRREVEGAKRVRDAPYGSPVLITVDGTKQTRHALAARFADGRQFGGRQGFLASEVAAGGYIEQLSTRLLSTVKR